MTNKIKLFNNTINFDGYDIAVIDINVPESISQAFRDFLKEAEYLAFRIEELEDELASK